MFRCQPIKIKRDRQCNHIAAAHGKAEAPRCFGRVGRETRNIAADQPEADRRDHEEQAPEHVAGVQLNLVPISEAAPEQDRKADVGERIEKAELRDLARVRISHGHWRAQRTSERRRLDMDDPHPTHEEQRKQREHGEPCLAVQGQPVVVHGPALHNRQDGPKDGARRMPMMGCVMARKPGEITWPESREGQRQQRQHVQVSPAIRHCASPPDSPEGC